MAELRPIDTDKMLAPDPMPDGGAAPQLMWIDIDRLVVDAAYQREVGRAGRATITKIAAAFNWSYFSPVVCAPVEAGFYAIIDGQHRATAARLVGKSSLPCSVVICPLVAQAGAFAAINGLVTRMHRTALHRAAVAAGDAKAVLIESVARDGGASICRSPTSLSAMARGETQSITALGACIDRFGRETVVRALRALTTETRNYRGMISPEMLIGLCLLLKRRDVTQAQFDAIDLYRVEAAARRAKLERKTDALSLLICEAAAQKLDFRGAP